MKERRFNQRIIAGALVALFFGVALYIRVALPYAQVFVGDWIKFTGTDAYFFMRLVDNLVHNFPHLITFDPYSLYPGGSGIGIRSFYIYLLAGITWLIGLGSPTQHTIDVVGVYFPAVLGALTTIPVYFIGKSLFNRWAGVIAAGLIAILPGEFLGRSILGFTDYHVAEVLFTTITMLFLILGVKSAKQRDFTFQLVKDRGWGAIAKPFIYSLLAGIFLGIYILTWSGALLFVFIIFTFLVIQFVIDHLRNKSVDYLCFISTITFLVTLLISLPASPGRMFLASLAIAIAIPIVMAVFSNLMTRRDVKPIIYPAAIIGLGLISLVIFRIVTPSLFQTMMGKLYIFAWPTKTTVMEMRPLLLPLGSFSWIAAWGNFNTSFFLCFIALGILVYSIVKRGESDRTLFVIWSLVILAATLSMRRFTYYFAVNVALLVGYLSWLILEFSGFKRLMTVPAEASRAMEGKIRDKKKRRDERNPATSVINMVLGVIIVFFLVFYPNIGPLPGGKKPVIDTASNPQFVPSDAWCESLSWMRDNTPDPFNNPDFYYELYQRPPPGERYDYPQTAYGVTAWWDYGYWITRIGRRIPTSNPGTGHRGESRLFMAQDEEEANKILDRRGSKYVIVDYAIANAWSGKFYALATLSGNKKEKFFDVYYQSQKGVLKPVTLFYPEYYRSLVCRLYNFDGKQVVPRNSMVISYEQKVNKKGQSYKQITVAKSFSDYSAAEAYITAQKSDNYRIVGSDPFVSPVPLESLEHYKLVYSSQGTMVQPNGKMISEVKIFEYIE
jgi:oligosaccharyl transferase (archaeosortase A-associated)